MKGWLGDLQWRDQAYWSLNLQINLSSTKIGTTRYCVPPNMIPYEACMKYSEPELNQTSRANFHFQEIQGTEERGNDTTRTKDKCGLLDILQVKWQSFSSKSMALKKKRRNKTRGRKWDYYIKKGIWAKHDMWILFGSWLEPTNYKMIYLSQSRKSDYRQGIRGYMIFKIFLHMIMALWLCKKTPIFFFLEVHTEVVEAK